METAALACIYCGETITVPVDISAGSSQQFTEECPACSREVTLLVTIDREGEVSLRSDPHYP